MRPDFAIMSSSITEQVGCMNIYNTLKNKLFTREKISYLFWGVATSVMNVGLFSLLDHIGVNYKIANLVSVLSAKIAAYFTSKFFVFHTKCPSVSALVREIVSFVLARSFTMVIDFIGLILLVDVLNINKTIGKLIMTAIVIILNYYFSKMAVFKQTTETRL